MGVGRAFPHTGGRAPSGSTIRQACRVCYAPCILLICPPAAGLLLLTLMVITMVSYILPRFGFSGKRFMQASLHSTDSLFALLPGAINTRFRAVGDRIVELAVGVVALVAAVVRFFIGCRCSWTALWLSRRIVTSRT